MNAVEIAAQYESHASAVAADILLLHAGHNYNAGDSSLSPTPMSEEAIITAVTNAHARIIAAARAQNPNVIVLYAKVITSGGDRAVKYSYIPALNTAIGALAEELNTVDSPVICVDMADGWNYATDCFSDCVHPNATGAAKMADKWMAAIQPFVNDGKLNVEPKAFGSDLPTAYSDWIVAEDTRLAGDMTVGALTVEAGVTLDLNGCKLTCSSVAGSGTITSTYSDLTQPDGTFAMVTPSAYYKGSVGNLFNNNTYYSQGDNDRLLLNLGNNNQKLPLRIDYDFGEGNAKKVNAYKFYAAWSQRAPKAWTLYGSNDSSAYNSASDDGWTEIKSVSGENRWSKGSDKDYEAEALSYTCDNTTAYRYYRLKITEHVGSNNYFEMVQLEYFCATPGELHLNVASGTADWPETITFSGNVKVVKDGAGTLAGKLQLDDVELVIESGEVTANDSDMHIGSTAGKSASVTVNGGKLSVSNQFKVGYNGSGTLTVNNGIVEVASGCNTYIAEKTGASGTINLNGGTLITRRVQHASGSSQTLNFNGGTLKTNLALSSYGLIRAGITVNVGEGGGTIDSGNLSDATSNSRVYVAAEICGTGAMRFKGGKTINIEGAMGYTGGTTVELGTMLNVTDATAKTTILGDLTVDGCTKTEDEDDIAVFQYSSALDPETDLENVTLANCGAGSATKVSGAQILVDFVAPVWELTADATWSALVAEHGTPAADATVIINAASTYTLTIDTDATVGWLAFTGAGSTTLAVSSGQTLTAGDITGAGAISNSGTIVKTGSGTATIPFDNTSTGEVIVNAGTLKVGSQTGTGTAYTVHVNGGATFDMNGKSDVNVNVILEEGAFFTNTGGNLGYNKDQAVSLTLKGDATVNVAAELGLIAPSGDPTSLELGSHTLTLAGSSTFRFTKTTITGDGTIDLAGSCTVIIPNNSSSTGESCTLTVGSGTTLNIGGSLSVKNFTNNGTIGTLTGTLTVTGTLTPGNAIKNLTLGAGATIKASATQVQTVSTTFSASGTIWIDASAITKEQFKDAGKEGISVLTVPADYTYTGVNWNVDGTRVDRVCAKWRVNDDGTKTLYIVRRDGFRIIVR